MPEWRDVEAFLDEVKAAISLGHVKFVRRRKNEEGLLALNLNEAVAWTIIEKLTPNNYYAGPKTDHDDPDEDVWEFGYDFEGREIYIKLTFERGPRRKRVRWAKVWSFHPPEHPIRYPLKGKRR